MNAHSDANETDLYDEDDYAEQFNSHAIEGIIEHLDSQTVKRDHPEFSVFLEALEQKRAQASGQHGVYGIFPAAKMGYRNHQGNGIVFCLSESFRPLICSLARAVPIPCQTLSTGKICCVLTLCWTASDEKGFDWQLCIDPDVLNEVAIGDVYKANCDSLPWRTNHYIKAPTAFVPVVIAIGETVSLGGFWYDEELDEQLDLAHFSAVNYNMWSVFPPVLEPYLQEISKGVGEDPFINGINLDGRKIQFSLYEVRCPR